MSSVPDHASRGVSAPDHMLHGPEAAGFVLGRWESGARFALQAITSVIYSSGGSYPALMAFGTGSLVAGAGLGASAGLPESKEGMATAPTCL